MLIDAINDVPYIADPVEVGRGGFATVHRATDLQADRSVAVKLLSVRTDDSNLKYFDRERQSLARLSTHPNVVTLHRTGVTTGGVPYLVMEFAPGGSLADRLKADGPFGWADAVAWLLPICDAVLHAHDQGIRHRDIKPQNILVSAHGNPLLSDFGIAGLAAGPDTVTEKAKLSLDYASPEQIEGRPLDNSTDVYSLGATLYTLIAGKPAFADTNGAGLLKTAKRVLEEKPSPLGADVPTAIGNAIAAAMAKNPLYRPTVEEFRKALAQDINIDPPPPDDHLPDITRELDWAAARPAEPILAAAPDRWSPTIPGPEQNPAPEHQPRGVATVVVDPRRSLSLGLVALLLIGGLVAAAWTWRDGDSTAGETAAGETTVDEQSAALSPTVGTDDRSTDEQSESASDAGNGAGDQTLAGQESDRSDSEQGDGDRADDDGADTQTVVPATTTTPDGDNDGTPDVDDNCPDIANEDQANRDGDTSGDACDPDDDGDGVPDGQDNCRLDTNPAQEDVDEDQIGDACDDFPDRDRDGIIDTNDDCVENPGDRDTDGDGTPDRCDDSPRGMAVVAAAVQIDRVTIINLGEDDGKPDMFGDLVVDGTKFGLPEITDQADIRPGNWLSGRVPIDPDSPLVQVRIWIRDEAGFCLFCKDKLVDISPATGMNALHLLIDTNTGVVDLAGENWNRLETVGTMTGTDDGDLNGAFLQFGEDDGVHRASIELSITLAREPNP